MFFCVIQSYWNGGAGDPNRTLQCDYLVGADGSASAVRRALMPELWATAPEVVYYQEYCPCKDIGTLRDGCWHVFFEKNIGKLLCCVHRKDNFLVPCVGGFRGDDVRATMDAFKKFLKENFKVMLGQHERAEGCIIKMWPPNPGSGRVLLVGEAGGFRYLNDAAMDAAMDSGYRCGAAIARALREGGAALRLLQGKSGRYIAPCSNLQRSDAFFCGIRRMGRHWGERTPPKQLKETITYEKTEAAAQGFGEKEGEFGVTH